MNFEELFNISLFTHFLWARRPLMMLSHVCKQDPECHALLQIIDQDSQYVRRADADTIFIVSNFQTNDFKNGPFASVNDEHALMRFEFLEAIVRIAIAKYGKVHPLPASHVPSRHSPSRKRLLIQ